MYGNNSQIWLMLTTIGMASTFDARNTMFKAYVYDEVNLV